MGETSCGFNVGVQHAAEYSAESDASDPEFVNNAPYTYERKRKARNDASAKSKRSRLNKQAGGIEAGEGASRLLLAK